MDIHKNARLTVHGREWIVRQVISGQTPKAVALAAGMRLAKRLQDLAVPCDRTFLAGAAR